MDRETIVVGIDHGWKNMKTVHSTFTSGVKELTRLPAIYENVLEYEGKFYRVDGERMEVKADKVQDDSFYLLTLAALGKELNQRGLQEAHVLLAVGLPLTRFGEERDSFIDYLKQNKEIEFRFEKKLYRVWIERVSVYPQCYAAVVNRIQNFPNRVLIVDIGSWTVDVMPIINRSPDESICVTKPNGVITCMKEINKECIKQINEEIDEMDIERVILEGPEFLPKKYQDIVVPALKDYCKKIYHFIREMGYNMELTPIFFVGGGAVLMKQFGNLKKDNISYIEDIRANARGFEALGKVYLERVVNRNAG